MSVKAAVIPYVKLLRAPSKKDKRRFMEKVRKTPRCWLWTASVDSKGFGQLGFTGMPGGLIKAARFSWLLHKGPIRTKHKVRQSCGNKLCVRPSHLYTSEEHRPGNYFTLDSQTRNFLDGLLLGDGSYTSSKFSAALTIGQRSDRIGWLKDIQRFLAVRGVPLLFSQRPAQINQLKRFNRIQKIHAREFTTCRTLSYRTLLAERERWYKSGKKRVPRDLDLTDPVLLAQWYMGDGNVYWTKQRGIIQLDLNTQGFPVVDVRWLADEFEKCLGLKAHVKRTSIQRGRKPVLGFSSRAARGFIDLVRPHMSRVFDYKVPVVQAPISKRARLIKYAGIKQSLSSWSKQTKIGARTISSRLSRRWPIKEALNAPVGANYHARGRRETQLKYGAVEQSLSTWSKQTGINARTIRSRLSSGWPIKEAVTYPSGTNYKRLGGPAKTRLKHDGAVQSLSSWAKHTGIAPRTIAARISRGWSIKKALTAPVGPNYRRRKRKTG